jgi:hypothetical protein
MVETEKLETFGFTMLLITALFFLSGQLQSLYQETDVSTSYITFYIGLRDFVLPILVFGAILEFLDIFKQYSEQKEWTPSVGFIYSLNLKAHPFADLSFGQKILIFVSLTISATGGLLLINSFIATTPGGIVFFPVPNAINEGSQITQAKSLWLSSVIPGALEDAMYNNIIASLIFTAISFIAVKLGADLDKKSTSIGLILLSCLISASGVSIWVIPGFGSAHQTYSANLPAFISVFLFGFMSSFLNLSTGLFFSFVAHIAHNALVSYSTNYNVQIFGLAIGRVGVSATPVSSDVIGFWLVVIIGLPLLLTYLTIRRKND